MNKLKAIVIVLEILKTRFKYIYKEKILNMDTLHLTFFMASSTTHNLQMNFVFKERFVDILCFISPTIHVKEEYLYEILKTVNYVNNHVKTLGRFYLDDYSDLVYSLRIKYSMLEQSQDICIKEIEGAVDLYSDIYVPVLKVLQGEESYEYIKAYIDNIWGN